MHIFENNDKYYHIGRSRRIQCTNCQHKGHNKVSCKNPIVAPKPNPKKRQRPKLDPTVVTRQGEVIGPKKRC